jgi:hypothetical protein
MVKVNLYSVPPSLAANNGGFSERMYMIISQTGTSSKMQHEEFSEHLPIDVRFFIGKYSM